MAVTNRDFHSAVRNKKDEFYTQLGDIEKEMKYYREYLKDKIVLCNCDDPFESNFFKFFAMNFNSLGLKKLITTCYATSPVTGSEFDYFLCANQQFSLLPEKSSIPVNNRKRPYRVEITEIKDENGDGRIDLADVEYLLKNKKNTLMLLEGDGDFRSSECIEFLKQADVVITNPPFSLFREYVSQLIKFNKDFIIIGNQNSITYKEILPLIVSGKIWYGASIHSHGRDFRVPEDYPLRAYEYRTDEKGYKYINVKGVRWFTNVDYEQRHEEMILYKKYDPAQYPKYDNYDAIEVGKTADIPSDYYGLMGVPITYLDKYNQDQFEILGIDKDFSTDKSRFKLNGKTLYARLVIRRKVTEDENQTARNSNP